MRRRAWCAAALLALTVLGPAPAQAEPEQDLVIEGRRSAVTEIELTEPLQADAQAVVTGGKELAGVLIEPLGEQQPGFYAVLRLGRMPLAVLSANGAQFPPGRYRVRLFADAPVRITLRLHQQDAGRVVRPTRPLAVTTREARQPVAAGRSDAELRLRGAVPARRGALLLMSVPGTRLEQTYACATSTGSCRSLPARPPAPLSDTDPGVRLPSPSSGLYTTDLRGSDERRDAVFGVDGVRAEDGAIRAGVLTYAL